ncbi:DUF1016 N-terminal domain-containing protein [Sphingobacterium sp. UGAL515B_05]|uniref:DUF1016 N-terminal domain-containing protein n=1 Tax=Sphingobacterium sp. UGAL515B_05 TaxID=2986767 RepID=UPI0039878562
MLRSLSYLISGLSKYLSVTLGKGFSAANLRNMRHFYQTFPDFDQSSTQRVENFQSVTQCVTKLSWANTRL